MALDLLCGFLLVILTGAGFRSGMLAQLTRFVALTLIFFGAPPLANAVVQELYSAEALEQTALRLGAIALAAAAIYLVTMILSYVLLRSRDQPTRRDKLAGAVLGLFKALAIIYLITDGAIFLEPRLQEVDPDDTFHIQDSRLVDATRDLHEAAPWVQPPKAKLPRVKLPQNRVKDAIAPKKRKRPALDPDKLAPIQRKE
jgi:hypothetical protein